MFGLVFGLLIGLFSGLISTLIWGLIWGLIYGFSGLLTGLLIAGIAGPFFGSANFDEENITQRQIKMIPNEGILLSLKNGIVMSAISGVSIGSFAWLMFGRSAGIIVGMTAGLISGQYYGGKAVIQHYILRLILFFNRLFPLNCSRFLDYCAERIFLRKVGGDYIFVHRLLMEHFASLYTDQSAAPPTDGATD